MVLRTSMSVLLGGAFLFLALLVLTSFRVTHQPGSRVSHARGNLKLHVPQLPCRYIETKRVAISGQPCSNTSTDAHTFQSRVVSLLADLLEVSEGDEVFENGFGCGEILCALKQTKQVQIFGVDASPYLVDDVARRCGAESTLCTSSYSDLSWVRSRQFDSSFAPNLLSLTSKTEEICNAAKELARITRHGGIVWVGTTKFDEKPAAAMEPSFWMTCLDGLYSDLFITNVIDLLQLEQTGNNADAIFFRVSKPEQPLAQTLQALRRHYHAIKNSSPNRQTFSATPSLRAHATMGQVVPLPLPPASVLYNAEHLRTKGMKETVKISADSSPAAVLSVAELNSMFEDS